MGARLIAISVALSILAGAGWYIDNAAYDRGVQEVREEVQKTADEAAKRNAAVHKKQIETLMEAHDAKEKRLQTISDDHGHALHELGRLRAAASAGSASGVPAAITSPGSDYASAVADVLGLCGTELVKLARAADGHAADALMLQQAWPK